MRRFYAPVDNFNGKTVILDLEETRHLRDVLRLKNGDEVSVFDGNGREFRSSIFNIGKKGSELTILDEMTPASPESLFEITLAATVLNGDRYDLIIQKAVELGVATLVPLETIRGDVKARDAIGRLVRWRRIAMEATKQCGRARLMEITDPSTFKSVLENARSDETILFSERDGKNFSTVTADKKITALIGPKGGWDDSELETAKSLGIQIVTLGGRILRAETAAISLTTILQHRFGDLN